MGAGAPTTPSMAGGGQRTPGQRRGVAPTATQPLADEGLTGLTGVRLWGLLPPIAGQVRLWGRLPPTAERVATEP